MDAILIELDAVIKAARLLGYLDGLKAFAWWKDGVEMVGTCGMTLHEAIEQAKAGQLWNQASKDYQKG